MIRPLCLALFCAAPAQAMTIEDCQRIQSTLSKPVAAIAELRLAPTVTDDGWCRVIDGPLGGGLEWRVDTSGNAFTAQFRQDGLEVDGLGPFDMTGVIARDADDRFKIGPLQLETTRGDSAILAASSPPLADIQSGLTAAGLESAGLTVTGQAGLINDVLAWAFRLDKAAADSSLIAARDQRDEMLDWLNENAAQAIDPGSAAAFRAMVQAYPRARGAAEIRMQEDQPVQIGGLVSALLFGTSLTRGEAAQLIEEAGLRFIWTPG